jgi:hypothetical protein
MTLYRDIFWTAAAIFGPFVVLLPMVCLIVVLLNRPPPPKSLDPNEWPRPIQAIHERLIAGQSAMTMEGYLQRVSLLDKYGIFQIHNATPEALEFLTEELKLSPSPRAKQPIYFRSEGVPWASEEHGPVETFVSEGVLNGDEGDLYAVAYETETKTIFIEYRFNF